MRFMAPDNGHRQARDNGQRKARELWHVTMTTGRQENMACDDNNGKT